MPGKVKEIKPPTGFSRLLFRLPLWLYRLGLGRVLGRRFLELTHIGRKSGLPRRTVLEVVRFEPSSGTYYVAVAFGKRTDWYRNILANPAVEVSSAGDHTHAAAVPLSPEEAGEELLSYSQRHPLAFRELMGIIGYRVDGTPEDTRALGRYIPVIALKPLEGDARGVRAESISGK